VGWEELKLEVLRNEIVTAKTFPVGWLAEPQWVRLYEGHIASETEIRLTLHTLTLQHLHIRLHKYKAAVVTNTCSWLQSSRRMLSNSALKPTAPLGTDSPLFRSPPHPPPQCH